MNECWAQKSTQKLIKSAFFLQQCCKKKRSSRSHATFVLQCFSIIIFKQCFCFFIWISSPITKTSSHCSCLSVRRKMATSAAAANLSMRYIFGVNTNVHDNVSFTDDDTIVYVAGTNITAKFIQAFVI